MKSTLGILIFMIGLSLNAQIVLNKDHVKIYAKENQQNYTLVTETEENLAVSIKYTMKGYRIALQRNATASNFNFYVKKENVSKKDNCYVLISEDQSVILKVRKEQITFYLENYGLECSLTKNEQQRLYKYLSKHTVS